LGSSCPRLPRERTKRKQLCSSQSNFVPWSEFAPAREGRRDPIAMGRPSVEEVIDSLGFGWAQVQYAVLAYGVWMSDGVEVSMVTALTEAIGRELGLPGWRMASLSSILFVGVAIGSGLSGYIGDSYGRRVPCLASYFGVAFFGILSACSCTYTHLVVLRAATGVAMGVGMPASLALVSETAPAQCRVPLQASRGVVFAFGNLLAALVLVVDSRNLQNLHWRLGFVLGAVPPMVLGLLAALLLQESPAFLAEAGRHDEARNVLEHMRRLNGHDPDVVSVVYKTTDAQGGRDAAGGAAPPAPPAPLRWQRQLRVVFGRDLAYSTITLACCTFMATFVEYGTAYAEPRVFQVTHAALPAGWQLFTKYAVTVPIRVAVLVPAALLGKKRCLVLACSFGIALGIALFASTGGSFDRSFVQAVVYYGSTYLPTVGIALSILCAFQLSVEIYPTAARATGCASCVTLGRFGAVAAPFVYEFSSVWQRFYWIMACLAIGTAILCTFLPDHYNSTLLAGQHVGDAEEGRTKMREAEPLLSK